MTIATDESVYSLLAGAAKSNPNAFALTFIENVSSLQSARSLTYSELLKQVHQTIELIDELCPGVRRPVVSLLLPNIPDSQMLLWASERAGTANPLNPMLTDDALYSLMEKAGDGTWEKAERVTRRLPRSPKGSGGPR